MFMEVHQRQHPITARKVYFSSKYLIRHPHTSQVKTSFKSSSVIHESRESEAYLRVGFRETMLSSSLSTASGDCEIWFSPNTRSLNK